MADRVRIRKWEEPATGGSQEDSGPTEINPNEDGTDSRAVYLQNDSSADGTVEISRDASSNMTFKDGVVSGTKTLTELLSGEGSSDDDQVDTIIAVGETFTVKADHQHIVFEQLTIDGEYIVDGQSVILGASYTDFRKLAYFVDNGPIEGFASGAYREITGTVFPSSVIWYVDNTKSDKIVEKNITWSGVKETTHEWKLYDSDGSTVLITATDTMTHSGIFETNRTRVIVVA